MAGSDDDDVAILDGMAGIVLDDSSKEGNEAPANLGESATWPLDPAGDGFKEHKETVRVTIRSIS